MTHECGLYLDDYENITVYHMKDLARGKRRRVKETDVGHITVPQFTGLTIEKILEFAERHGEARRALPTERREIRKCITSTC